MQISAAPLQRTGLSGPRASTINEAENRLNERRTYETRRTMLVAELIEQLRTLPETACVVVRVDELMIASGLVIEAVIYDRGLVQIIVDKSEAAPIGELRLLETSAIN